MGEVPSFGIEQQSEGHVKSEQFDGVVHGALHGADQFWIGPRQARRWDLARARQIAGEAVGTRRGRRGRGWRRRSPHGWTRRFGLGDRRECVPYGAGRRRRRWSRWVGARQGEIRESELFIGRRRRRRRHERRPKRHLFPLGFILVWFGRSDL